MSKKDPRVGDQLKWHYAGPSDLKIVYVDDAIVVWRAKKTIDKVGGFPFGGGYGCATRYDYEHSGPSFVRRAPPFVGTVEIARRAGVTPKTVRNDILAGLLSPIGTRVRGRGCPALVFTRGEADKYIKYKRPQPKNDTADVVKLAESLGVEEAAKQLNIKPESVRRALLRARKK